MTGRPRAARARALVGAAALAAAGALLLSGCGSSASGSTTPSWSPKPQFSGEGYQPSTGNNPSGPSLEPGQNPAPTPSPSGGSTADPAIVASKLPDPTGIAVLPDKSALVGERTTGRIVRVQPTAGQPVRTVRTLPGVDGAGDGGLLDLALSPNYAEDNLVFAYLSTAHDNRVVAFTLTGAVTTVLTGIPHGTSDNAGRIAFAGDGSLFVATGDAGTPSLAVNPNSLAGKVLRITDIGKPASGNPTRGSRVYASGLQDVTGLCAVASSNRMYAVDVRPTESADLLEKVAAGASYGWPSPGPGYTPPTAELPSNARAPGGCALVNNRIFVTTRDGQELLDATVAADGSQASKFTASLQGKYGRLLTVVAATDGSLWLTTANRDGHGKPKARDDLVLHLQPTTAGGSGASKV